METLVIIIIGVIALLFLAFGFWLVRRLDSMAVAHIMFWCGLSCLEIPQVFFGAEPGNVFMGFFMIGCSFAVNRRREAESKNVS